MNKAFYALVILCVLSLSLSLFIAMRLFALEARYNALSARLQSLDFSLSQHIKADAEMPPRIGYRVLKKKTYK